MRGQQVKHCAQEKIEGRRLLFQIEDAAPEVSAQQRGIDVLPVDLKRKSIEPDSECDRKKPGCGERSGQQCQAGSAALQHGPGVVTGTMIACGRPPKKRGMYRVFKVLA